MKDSPFKTDHVIPVGPGQDISLELLAVGDNFVVFRHDGKDYTTAFGGRFIFRHPAGATLYGTEHRFPYDYVAIVKGASSGGWIGFVEMQYDNKIHNIQPGGTFTLNFPNSETPKEKEEVRQLYRVTMYKDETGETIVSHVPASSETDAFTLAVLLAEIGAADLDKWLKTAEVVMKLYVKKAE